MRRNRALAILCLALPLFSQSTESPDLRKAREDARRVRELVEAGALPRRALEEAELVLAEALDEETLRRTLYGDIPVGDLTTRQAEDMISAARGLVDRQARELESAEALVREGALAAGQLEPYWEELQRRRKTLALAESRAALFEELVQMVRLEKQLQEALDHAPEEAKRIAERFDGSGVLLGSQFRVVEIEFRRRFGKPLPISANGDTPLHRSMGFDHAGRYDVALHPDSEQGSWLRGLLERLRIPYFAFRGVVAGKSTGAHIHIGPPSERIDLAN